MFRGRVSRGRYLGSVRDCDRIATTQGAGTIALDYPPNQSDPFHDRVYRDANPGGGVTEVWCRAEELHRLTDTSSIESETRAPRQLELL